MDTENEMKLMMEKMQAENKKDFEEQRTEFIPKVVSHLINWCNRAGERQRFKCTSYESYPRSLSFLLEDSFGLNNSIAINRIEQVDLTKSFCSRHIDRIAKFISDVQAKNSIVTESTKWPMDHDAFCKYLKQSEKLIKKQAAIPDNEAGQTPQATMDANNEEEQTNTAILRPAAKSNSLSLAERVSAYVDAYDTITVTASLVFSFGVSLAAGYSSEAQFTDKVRMSIFHIFISICIAASLHCIAILSMINYKTNRHLGSGLTDKGADFIELTYKYRNHARISFCISLVLFVLSLCVLYFDGLPTWLASVNTAILSITIIFVGIALRNISMVSNR